MKLHVSLALWLCAQTNGEDTVKKENVDKCLWRLKSDVMLASCRACSSRKQRIKTTSEWSQSADDNFVDCTMHETSLFVFLLFRFKLSWELGEYLKSCIKPYTNFTLKGISKRVIEFTSLSDARTNKQMSTNQTIFKTFCWQFEIIFAKRILPSYPCLFFLLFQVCQKHCFSSTFCIWTARDDLIWHLKVCKMSYFSGFSLFFFVSVPLDSEQGESK